MERGPMALFAAIIAVGLGPAMWLGTQFGQNAVTPLSPAPARVVEGPANAPGRAGAADDASASEDEQGRAAQRVNTGVNRRLDPVSNTPAARPSTTRPPEVAVPSDEPPTPTPTISPTPSRTVEATTPPTESTTSPAAEGPEEPDEPEEQPSTPDIPPSTGAGSPTDVEASTGPAL